MLKHSANLRKLYKLTLHCALDILVHLEVLLQKGNNSKQPQIVFQLLKYKRSRQKKTHHIKIIVLTKTKFGIEIHVFEHRYNCIFCC